MKILVPIAGEESAFEIAEYVVAVARQLDAELTILHVLKGKQTTSDGKNCCAIFSEAAHDTGVSVTAKVVKGELVDTIIEVAKKIHADLIVMGASRGNVVEKWLSADVMEESETPVLVVPHCYNKKGAVV